MDKVNNADFRQLQSAFAAHLRNPDQAAPPPGVSRERATVYRELVFTNIKGFLDSNFPVLREILGDSRWREVVEKFVAEHSCQTPYFLEVGREFLTWLRAADNHYLADIRYAEELAHYEWAELAIAVAEDDPPQTFAGGSLLDTVPQVSANAWPLRYDFPVHQIGPDYQPDELPAEQTFLLVYRDAEFNVQFMEINALTWILLEHLRGDSGQTARLLLEQIAAGFPQLDPQLVVDGGAQTLQELVTRGVICGSLVA